MKKHGVILANGSYPESGIPLGYLNAAEKIICCDGAVVKLVQKGMEPWAIVGDLDSVPVELEAKYSDRLYRDDDQDTNDLTKAVRFAIGEGFESIVILGATGVREDHTIGNISLLTEYARFIEVIMVTDFGIFIPLFSGTKVSCIPGQQVSVFSPATGSGIRSHGLKYPLDNLSLENWWMGTLNEATGESISLEFDGNDPVLVYLAF
ncbi:MAG: thiamine diphosphokinase [Bacteroidales bacterium]